MKYSIDLNLLEEISIDKPTVTSFHFEIENSSTDGLWIPSYASISNDNISFEHKTDYYNLDELSYLVKYLKLLSKDECPPNVEIDFLESDIVFLLNPFGFNDRDFEIRFYLYNHQLSSQFFSVTFEEEHTSQLINFLENYLKKQGNY